MTKIFAVALAVAACLVSTTPVFAAEQEVRMSEPNAHSFTFKMMDGGELPLSDLKGKVVLVVNTASQCGFTPQYRDLQTLHETYKDKGLVVIGVPSADFGGQEFDTEQEVQDFTEEEFSITFPLTTISTVKGGDAHPFYAWANKKAGMIGKPKWNFHKYLIGKDGDFVAWFATTTSPTASKLTKAIEAELVK